MTRVLSFPLCRRVDFVSQLARAGLYIQDEEAQRLWWARRCATIRGELLDGGMRTRDVEIEIIDLCRAVRLEVQALRAAKDTSGKRGGATRTPAPCETMA